VSDDYPLAEFHTAFKALTVDGTPEGDLLAGGLEVCLEHRHKDDDEQIVLRAGAGGRMHRELLMWNPFAVAVTVYRVSLDDAYAHAQRVATRFRMMRSQGGAETHLDMGAWTVRDVTHIGQPTLTTTDTSPTSRRTLWGVTLVLQAVLQAAYTTQGV
jgi:hypothetical protein